MSVKPFGFDRVFSLSGKEPEAVAPIMVDTSEHDARIAALEAEIAQLGEAHHAELAQARIDGFNAGLDQARQDRGVALLAATDAIHAAIEQVDARLHAEIETIVRDAAAMALAAGEAICGHAVDHLPMRGIGEALDRVLRQVARGTRLTLRVHPDLLEDVEAMIAVRASQDRRKLEIAPLADPTLALGDAQIFWEEGGVILDQAARRAAVEAEIAPLLEGRLPEAI